MYEVKVYDKAARLKKVISIKTLSEREDEIFKNPSLIRKHGRQIKTRPIDPELALQGLLNISK